MEPKEVANEETENMEENLGTPQLGQVVDAPIEYLEDQNTLTWMKEQAMQEKESLKKNGANAIVLPVRSIKIQKEENKTINIVQVDAMYNFSQVTQIMVSDTKPCTVKENYLYVNVVLLPKNSSSCLLLPYIFEDNTGNELTDWVFENKKGQRAKHRIKSFKQITK